jgi:hypothetical protein
LRLEELYQLKNPMLSSGNYACSSIAPQSSTLPRTAACNINARKKQLTTFKMYLYSKAQFIGNKIQIDSGNNPVIGGSV